MNGEDRDKERWHALLMPLRLLMHGIIKAIVIVFIGIRTLLRLPAVRLGLAALVVAGVVGWQLFGASLTGARVTALSTGGRTEGISLSVAESQLPPSPVVERYIQALAESDAQTMWSLFSDEMKDYMQSSNGGQALATLQAGLDSVKEKGGRYVGGTYVGGAPLGDGKTAYFYVLDVETPNGGLRVPYIYTVGPDGKIANVE